MQRKPVEGKILFQIAYSPLGAVTGVADHRVTGQLSVAPDLMLAAGAKVDFHQRVMFPTGRPLADF